MSILLEEWRLINIEGAKNVGILGFEGRGGDEDTVEVLGTKTHLVFGSPTNNTFLQSGYIEKREDESWSECLAELHADLETYYRDGAEAVSRMVCNERM